MDTSDKEDPLNDVYSESSLDDDVYVPCDVQVDGRKREAKQLKSRTRVP